MEDTQLPKLIPDKLSQNVPGGNREEGRLQLPALGQNTQEDKQEGHNLPVESSSPVPATTSENLRKSTLNDQQKDLARIIAIHYVGRNKLTLGQCAEMAGYKVDEKGDNRNVYDLLKKPEFRDEIRKHRSGLRYVKALKAQDKLLNEFNPHPGTVKDVIDREEGLVTQKVEVGDGVVIPIIHCNAPDFFSPPIRHDLIAQMNRSTQVIECSEEDEFSGPEETAPGSVVPIITQQGNE